MSNASKPSEHADDGDSDDGSTPKATPLTVGSLSPEDPSSPNRTPKMSRAKLAQGTQKEGGKPGSAALPDDCEPDHPSDCACEECVSNHIHKAIKGMSKGKTLSDKTLLGCVCEDHIKAGKKHFLECFECSMNNVPGRLQKGEDLAKAMDEKH